MAELESWTANAEPGVRFFSGTATYRIAFEAPRSWFGAQARLLLDLGAVRDLAEVTLNGQRLSILWKPPYELNVTGVLRPGTNRLEVQVTNQWTNRQLGDRSLPPEQKILTPIRSFFPDPAEPPPSGLLGPVTLVALPTAAPR